MSSGNDLVHVKAMIIVFAMKDCPHCEEYKPLLERELKRFQAAGFPFDIYDGKMVPPGRIPVLFLDATTPDPTIQKLMDDYGVEGVPVTLLLTRSARPWKHEGPLPPDQIYELLHSAALANR